MPWPFDRKNAAASGSKHSVINPATGESKFAKEQDAIDLKYAWYDAGYPPDWIKPKKPKKRRCN